MITTAPEQHDRVRTCLNLALAIVVIGGMVTCSSGAGQPTRRLPDDQAIDLMYALSGSDHDGDVQGALTTIVRANDDRFVSVLIEMLRFDQLGILTTDLEAEAYIRSLERISGQHFGPDWPSWIEWYGETDLIPPPGFTTWKGDMLGRIDPLFTMFLKEELPSRIRVEEIQWGGVLVDGIPALDNPNHLRPEQATYMNQEDAVFGIVVKDEARAYPLRIVDWHEMVNDFVGGVPISLAYCTLCGAAIPYVGRTSDGHIYTFGSSGLLYRSNKLMYDHQTHTLWNQLTGEPVLGDLADTDIHLDYLPIVLTTWGDWLAEHPETYVLDINTGFNRPYEAGAAYGDYFSSPDTMFPVWQRSNLLDDKAQIYALNLNGAAKAYPIDVLVQEQVVNDMVGTTTVVLVTAASAVIVQGATRDGSEVAYLAGAEVRAYDRGDETFSRGPTPNTLHDSQGRLWEISEIDLSGPEGLVAPRLSGHLAYWFGWFAMFPHTEVYGYE